MATKPIRSPAPRTRRECCAAQLPGRSAAPPGSGTLSSEPGESGSDCTAGAVAFLFFFRSVPWRVPRYRALGHPSATLTHPRYNRYPYALSAEFSEEHIYDNRRDTSKARARLAGDIDRHLRREVVCSPEKSHWVPSRVTRNVSRAKRNRRTLTDIWLTDDCNNRNSNKLSVNKHIRVFT
jgi:hypothetical protein